MDSNFRGVFLTSSAPAGTASFYQKVAGLPIEMVGKQGQYQYWRVDRDGMQLAIHDAKAFADYSFPPLPESNLTHLYFKIEEQKEFLSHLGALGLSPISVDDVVVTVLDPDGRKVMFGTA